MRRSVAVDVGDVSQTGRAARTIAMVLAAATAVTPFAFDAAQARKRPDRVVFEPYSPVGVNELVLAYVDPAVSLASVTLEPEPGERAVSLALKDDSGYIVRGSVSQGRETLTSFCGGTPKPVEIDPEQPVRVHVYTGTCGGSLGIATEGGVTARFR